MPYGGAAPQAARDARIACAGLANRNTAAEQLESLSRYGIVPGAVAFTMLTNLSRSDVGMLPYTGR